MTFANILTTIRIILVPVFVYALLIYPLGAPLPKIIFVISILTDALDGMFARFFKTKTQLGATLDPIADKLLVLSSYFVLMYINRLPAWLFVITLLRDVVIVSGFFIIYILTGSTRVKSRISGKITVIMQTLSVVFILFQLPYMMHVFYLTAATAFLSILDYCLKGAREITEFQITHKH